MVVPVEVSFNERESDRPHQGPEDQQRHPQEKTGLLFPQQVGKLKFSTRQSAMGSFS